MTPPISNNVQPSTTKSSHSASPNKISKPPSKPSTPTSSKTTATSNIPRIAASSNSISSEKKALSSTTSAKEQIDNSYGSHGLNSPQPNEKDMHYSEITALQNTKSVRSKKDGSGVVKPAEKKVVLQDSPEVLSSPIHPIVAVVPSPTSFQSKDRTYNPPNEINQNSSLMSVHSLTLPPQSQSQTHLTTSIPNPTIQQPAISQTTSYLEPDNRSNLASHPPSIVSQSNAQYIDGHFITSNQNNQTNQFSFDSNLMNDGERVLETSPNGRYAKLNTVLGKGAYKVVYKAIDREEGYEVAWNCFQTSRQEYSELSNEIEILKRVRHPNIINFHDCWYNNTEFVFVTELMTSGTLREYIRKLQTPNMKIVKRWARQILKGLLYLHSYNPPIIHRDIKCDNIFINGSHGEVKIGDMGTAKMKMGKRYTVIGESNHIIESRESEFVGTPEFMAPEMYEEKGYNEKVDTYAFGMCLLEMVVGEYPYSECKNAAQIYKKVSQGIKPACLELVRDPECLNLINSCLCEENNRFSVQQSLDHSFLAVEPEVSLASMNEEDKHQLTLSVNFRGTDKTTVKFDFNTETDTADEVVKEMIHENVLSEKYQSLITIEINKILRELNKPSNYGDQDANSEESKMSWKQQQWSSQASGMQVTQNSNGPNTFHVQGDVRDELMRTQKELQIAFARANALEKKAEMSEVRARMAEAAAVNYTSAPTTDRTLSGGPKAVLGFSSRGSTISGRSAETLPSELSHSPSRMDGVANEEAPLQTELKELPTQISMVSETQSNLSILGSPLNMPAMMNNGMVPSLNLKEKMDTIPPPVELPKIDEAAGQTLTPLTDSNIPLPGPIKEYADASPISDFVYDTAISTGRGSEKAREWLAKLQDQDIMTVGDLRDLEDDDWSGMGLTVFACRALRNALNGRIREGRTVSGGPSGLVPRDPSLHNADLGSVPPPIAEEKDKEKDNKDTTMQAGLSTVNQDIDMK